MIEGETLFVCLCFFLDMKLTAKLYCSAAADAISGKFICALIFVFDSQCLHKQPIKTNDRIRKTQ